MQRNSLLAGAEDILRDWKVRIDFLGIVGNVLTKTEGQEENKCDGGTRSGIRAWGKAGALL